MTKKNPYIKFNLEEIESSIDDILNSTETDDTLIEKGKKFEELVRMELRRIMDKI
jgi:hypothetical protein